MHTDAVGERPAESVGRLWRWVEFVGLFVVVPVALACEWRWAAAAGRSGVVPLIPFLVLVAVVCLVVLLRDAGFDRRRLWNARDLGRRLRRVLWLFLLCGVGLMVLAAVFEPGRFLWLPRRHAVRWLILMVAYPVLSVYPQELIFRSFLFRRYGVLFPRPWMLIAASATVFGLAHLPFWNAPALVMSTLGGVLFARTYHRTRSLLVTAVEHALYGCLIISVGFGHYFWHGTLRHVMHSAGQ